MKEVQNNFLLSAPAQALKPSDALRLHADEAYERFKAIRWGWTDGRPQCPKCEHDHIYELRNRAQFRCAKCGTSFSVTSKTAFASRKMAYRDLLGVISYRLHHRASPALLTRELDINYRSAWAISKKLVLFGNSVIRTRDRMWPFVETEKAADPGRDLMMKVNSLLPRGMPEQVRADVAQDMILGVLSGELTEADLANSMKKYVTRYYKGYDNRFACLSFDQEVPGTDGQRWDDRIADDPFKWDRINS